MIHSSDAELNQFTKGYKGAALNFALSSDLPLSLACSPELMRIASFLRNDVPNITRDDLRPGLTTIYNKDLVAVKQRLAQVKGKFAVTINELKENSRGYLFLAVTLHYLDDDFAHQSVTIGFETVRKMCYAHDLLCETAFRVFSEHDLKTRILSITMNNALLIRPFVDTLRSGMDELDIDNEIQDKSIFLGPTGYESTGCVPAVEVVFTRCVFGFLACLFFRHPPENVTQMVESVKRAHPELADLNRSLQYIPHQIRDTVAALREEHFINRNFVELTRKRDSDPEKKKINKRLQKDQRGDWRSTLEMLEQFLECQEEIAEVYRRVSLLSEEERDNMEFECPNFTEAEWKHVSDIRDTLKTFQKQSMRVKNFANGGISDIVQCVHKLQKEFADSSRSFADTNPFIALALRRSHDILLGYLPFHAEDIEPMETFYMATVADPRFKLGLFKDLKFLEAKIVKIEKRFFEVCASYKVQDENDASTRSPVKKRQRRAAAEPLETSKGISVSADTEEEVKKYLAEKRLRKSDKVVEFYKTCTEYPTVRLVARDYLAILARAGPLQQLTKLAEANILRDPNGVVPSEIRMAALLRAHKTVTKARKGSTDDEESDF